MSFHKPHLDMAHSLWHESVQPGDTVIDATCGNGQDTRILAKLALNAHQGTLFALDIQAQAIVTTRNLLEQELPQDLFNRITFLEQCHSHFPEAVLENSVRLIIYNLGYLPGANKALTTRTETTLQSLQEAQKLLLENGIICVTCYPGHDEGKKEEAALLDYVRSLPTTEWQVSFTQWVNRVGAPSLLVLRKA
ncbi:MAG: methyltransferase domain-containing protein [Parachlamydiaceae bacterium]|nr:methyltransferase domain-containing protein [Parachlamydiaceae bacterium]